MLSVLRRLSFVLAILLVAGAAPHARTILAAMPISRIDLPWWKERHEAVLERLRHGQVDLVFLGDSITQNWERSGPPDWAEFQPVWRHFYGDRNAVNLGFIGDTTASLLWRIRNGEVAGIAPKLAIILIGANNLGRLHWSAEDTLAGIQTILADLRKRLPTTKLLLIGVLPSDRSPWASETTAMIDAALKARFGVSGDVVYFDPMPVFLRNGRLDRDLFYDPRQSPPGAPLHPTAQGMRKLAEAMEPMVASLMGVRPKL